MYGEGGRESIYKNTRLRIHKEGGSKLSIYLRM